MHDIASADTRVSPISSRTHARNRRVADATGQHWIVFTRPALGLLASVLFAIALLIVSPGWLLLAVMPLVVCLLDAARVLEKRLCFTLTVGPSHIKISDGPRDCDTIALRLEDIRGLEVRQNPLGQILGCGDVSVRSAYGHWVFRNVTDPALFRKRVREAVAARRRAVGPQMQSPPIGGAPSESLQNRRLGSASS